MASGMSSDSFVKSGPLRRNGNAEFVSDASYLITGGLGGLGLLAARWMVERGARYLVLIGRGAPSADAERQIAGLEQASAHVVVRQADVSDASQLSAVLSEIEKYLAAVAGRPSFRGRSRRRHPAAAGLDAVQSSAGGESERRVESAHADVFEAARFFCDVFVHGWIAWFPGTGQPCSGQYISRLVGALPSIVELARPQYRLGRVE
jgi:hypothetical protein